MFHRNLYALFHIPGFINTLLAWPGMVTLSRLTYMAYLIHPIVIFYYLLSRQSLIFADDMVPVRISLIIMVKILDIDQYISTLTGMHTMSIMVGGNWVCALVLIWKKLICWVFSLGTVIKYNYNLNKSLSALNND